jgi:ribosomal protein S12 methylthiotransferase
MTQITNNTDNTDNTASTTYNPVANNKVGFVSLGCPKALVDSERILTQLRAEGYDIASNYHDAEVVIVNTCGFITPAIEESLAAIGEALEESGKVIVTGCLGERPETIIARHPNVLSVTGPGDVTGVMNALHQVLPADENPFTSLLPVTGVKLTPRHYAYLKVAEGCNHTCSFCIIPKLRGRQVSRDAGEVLYEAYRLVAAGTKELLVIAQDLSAYGVDLRHRESEYQEQQVVAHLVDLCTQLGKLGAWVRLHYVYPYPHVDKIVALMAEGKILPYLDVPLQHASPRILKLMRRPGAGKQLETIRRWRELCPEIILRSTFIVGFPGETEEDFQLLLDFLTEARLDRVGAFTYSEVPEADANALADPVPEAVKQERYQRLMTLQQAISAEKQQAKVGKRLQVIIDEYNDDEEDIADGIIGSKLIGRSQGDAPGIDGNVYVAAGSLTGSIKIGDIIEVLIEEADEYDLFGEAQAVVAWQPNVLSFGSVGLAS